VLRCLALLFLLLVSACTEKLSADPIEAAKGFVAPFQTGKYSAVEAVYGRAIRQEDEDAPFRQMFALFPRQRLLSVTGDWGETTVRHISGGAETTVDVVLVYRFEGDDDLRVFATLIPDAKSFRLTNLRFQLLPHALIAENAFSLAGKPFASYVFLAVAALAPIAIAFALFLLWRSPSLERRWILAALMIAGPIAVTLNWTTGEFSLALLHFQVLGTGVSQASPYDPWMIGVALPVFVITVGFIVLRKDLLAVIEREKKASIALTGDAQD
jgi:hypothetical protein